MTTCRNGMRLISALAAAALCLAGAAPVCAQDYPAKPVRIIVPTAAGGLTDLLPRTLAQRLQVTTKQAWIVENRAGAGGIIGAEAAAKASADGYTLMMGFHGTQSILPALGVKLPYDPDKDFAPIIHVASVPNVLVVNPSVPAKTVQELVALAKAKPGSVSFASQGNGSSGHMAGEMFKLAAGIDIVHVAYRGAAPAMQDLMGGQVTMMFDILPLAMANVRAGKLRALAVATTERVAAAPEVPTMTEAGVPGVEGGAWFALYAPTGTPRPIIEWLNREANKVFSDPEVRDKFAAQGASFPLGSPEALGAFQAAETQRWSRVVRTAGIHLD
jgi:tripartite-type tricarboxylate transporter receptor subunit TctC